MLVLILEFGYVQIVDFPNRGHSILNIFFKNFPSYNYRCQPLPNINAGICPQWLAPTTTQEN